MKNEMPTYEQIKAYLEKKHGRELSKEEISRLLNGVGLMVIVAEMSREAA